MPRIVVVGLGPAGADLTLVAARDAIATIEPRFVRTVRHPAVDDLVAEGLTFASFDDVYERAEDFDAVYAEIADTLIAAAREHGTVLYAVPGSPMLAERTVQGLLARAASTDVTIDLIPGLSFADLAWARVGVDEMERGRILDGHRFANDASGASGPTLIAQVDDTFIASDIKLALLDVLPADAPVMLLQRLGLPDEYVATVPLEDLDRVIEPDHLTSVFVDLGDAAVGTAVADLLAVNARLREECPWYTAQTHHSLVRFLIEEAYETAETIDALPEHQPGEPIEIGEYAELEEELGDLLYQVVFHTRLAQESGAFTFEDVARGITEKLIRRNPHVFGDTEVTSIADIETNWLASKRAEGKGSSFSGIPKDLPALVTTQKLAWKAQVFGLTAEDLIGSAGASELARELSAPALIAGGSEIDAEAALRTWNAALRDRLQAFEAVLQADGIDPATADRADIQARWKALA